MKKLYFVKNYLDIFSWRGWGKLIFIIHYGDWEKKIVQIQLTAADQWILEKKIKSSVIYGKGILPRKRPIFFIHDRDEFQDLLRVHTETVNCSLQINLPIF